MTYKDDFIEYARECYEDCTSTWEELELPEYEFLDDVFDGVINDTGMPLTKYLIVELTIIQAFCDNQFCIYADYEEDVEGLKNELYDITYLSESKDIMQRLANVLVNEMIEFEDYVDNDADIKYDFEDAWEYQKNPLGYYGMSQSDFI